MTRQSFKDFHNNQPNNTDDIAYELVKDAILELIRQEIDSTVTKEDLDAIMDSEEINALTALLLDQLQSSDDGDFTHYSSSSSLKDIAPEIVRQAAKQA